MFFAILIFQQLWGKLYWCIICQDTKGNLSYWSVLFQATMKTLWFYQNLKLLFYKSLCRNFSLPHVPNEATSLITWLYHTKQWHMLHLNLVENLFMSFLNLTYILKISAFKEFWAWKKSLFFPEVLSNKMFTPST